MDEELYQVWLKSLFDHDEAKGDWRFGSDVPEVNTNEDQIVAFVTRMLNRYESDVAPYSDWQIAMGIDFVFNNACSDYAFHIRNNPVPLEQRIAAIEAIKTLYAQCFEPRCEPALGHLAEDGNPLNDICYMFWDTSPLGYCEDCPDKAALYKATTGVMEYALGMDNVACVESGLHGLGHLAPYYPPARDIIKRFLRQSSDADQSILEYAEAAREGCIQ